MRAMVVGAPAPLGVAIVRALLATPGIEHVLGVGIETDAGLPEDPRVDYRAVDLTHPRALHDLVWGDAKDARIDTVVHCMQHRRGSDRGRRIHAQNVEATRGLVVACREHPTIARIVYRSFAEVYGSTHTTSDLLDEDAALDFGPTAPQWVRDRVEADLTVCAQLGGRVAIAVLRCAEVFAADTGSQLWDYLQSRVCFRPLGFDPMINVLSLDDAARAFAAAAACTATGVFNIPGADTLPLSRAIAASRRAGVPIPGPAMTPLYALRRWIAGFDFRYDLNLRRFHFGGVLDGTRARTELGYAPARHVAWP
ncbi:MAG: hypothetical protein KF773_33585 [Deltaproteobacteria bacterium]|nr:hypothetical protein [Deltaproteobacteria bacterium]MCW5805233.1 hypothetical protein [Deltaproteobacteria bacterium]